MARASVRSEFLQVMAQRGFIHQATDLEGLDAYLAGGRRVGYLGIDPTGASLHVGHLLPVMMLRWWQKCGHRPIALAGGGTALVGDPSGKDEGRPLLSRAEIAANIAGVRAALARFVDFDDPQASARQVDNADWLVGLDYIGFLRDYGRHFTINRMLTLDSVRLRLEREQPLTFLEFNYMILQAYDFLELYRRHECRIQLAGSDQWGNIVGGIDLARRMEGVELFGLTCPLLTNAAGHKMGKTAAGAVWVDPDRLPPYDYWQFWRNCEDADVGRFLALFTELPMDEVARLAALSGRDLNEAKKVLATEATALAHGRAAAEAAARTAAETFEQGALGADLPRLRVHEADLAVGLPVVELLVRAGLAKSRGEARRLIRQGGARLNDAPLEDEHRRLAAADLARGPAKLSAGKKRHALIEADEAG